MEFEDLLKSIELKINLETGKVSKEKRVIENFLLEITNTKVSIWKPWTYFSVFKKMQQAITVIGSIANCSLRNIIDIQETQINIIKVQKTFHNNLQELNRKIEG